MINEKNFLDFQDPGAIDEELTYVPGFVNRLTDYTLSQAHSPNRLLACAGALAELAHLAGRTYADTHGTRTNLFLIVLGDTGVGKDAPRRTNRRLADALGLTANVCDQIASGEALEELIARRPTLLFQSDEVEGFIGALRGTGRLAVGLSERIRRLYGASAGLYSVRATAHLPEGTVVAYPHLTLFGTGTPEAFYRRLTTDSIANGLYGRCLVLNAPDLYRANQPCDLPLPANLVETAALYAERERHFAETNELNLQTIGETEDAHRLLMESAEKTMILRQKLAERELRTARAIVVRMNEKIAKLSMIYALSADAEHPVITPDGVRWAARFVTHVTASMLYEAQFHAAEGRFDELQKRFVHLLAKHGGTLDRRTLIRSLHVDHLTFRRIVMTLHLCDEILEETEYGKNPIYTLKNAQ